MFISSAATPAVTSAVPTTAATKSQSPRFDARVSPAMAASFLALAPVRSPEPRGRAVAHRDVAMDARDGVRVGARPGDEVVDEVAVAPQAVRLEDLRVLGRDPD